MRQFWHTHDYLFPWILAATVVLAVGGGTVWAFGVNFGVMQSLTLWFVGGAFATLAFFGAELFHEDPRRIT